MLKATREAKQCTSWTANNVEFEDALKRFVEAVMQHEPFMTDVELFVNSIRDAGQVNSLAQTLMKHTAPGVPDLYQGGELWDLSLVDPDNRRPVDYQIRQKLLAELKSMPVTQAAAETMRRAEEGVPKLWTIHRALTLRRDRPASFSESAAYTPLFADGPKAEHVIA